MSTTATVAQAPSGTRTPSPDDHGSPLDRHRRGTRVAALLLLLIFAVVFLVPVVGVLITSFRTNGDVSAHGLWTLGGDGTAGNYKEAWSTGNARTYLLNSVLVTVPATLISVLLGTLVGYVVGQLRPRGSSIITLVFVAGLFVPPQILLIPLFKFFNLNGLYDTLWPMIIVHSGYGVSLCTLVMRNFFRAVPDELRESGLVDGASEPRILFSIIAPMARPALAALATLQFTFIWNDFLYPLIFTLSDERKTIMVGILAQQGQFSVAYGTQAALSVIASVPTVLVFILFQKHFIAGLTTGAVKG